MHYFVQFGSIHVQYHEHGVYFLGRYDINLVLLFVFHFFLIIYS